VHTSASLELFQSLIEYYVKLQRDGDIDDTTFKALVQQTTATFVETEISERVNTTLDKTLPLDQMLKLL
jgi:hypothetical protein